MPQLALYEPSLSVLLATESPLTAWMKLNYGWVAVAALTVLFVAMLVMAVLSARQAGKYAIIEWDPPLFFWLGNAYLSFLLLIATVFLLCATRLTLIGGTLPVAVPWFGALGAVTISLEGVFRKNKNWDRQFNYWHLARPLFGAVLGTVAFFLFVLVLSAAGTKPSFLTTAPSAGARANADAADDAAKKSLAEGGTTNDDAKAADSTGYLPADFIIYYVVAFLVGYRESTFRELIKRATDVIMGPGTPQASPLPAAVAFAVGGENLAELEFGDTALGTEQHILVEVHNAGGQPLANPQLALPAGPFSLIEDAVTGGGDIAPNARRTVQVKFSPVAAGPATAMLTIIGDNLAMRVLPVSGTGI